MRYDSGRDFEQFIIGQIFDRFVEGHLSRRREADFHIAAGGPYIGQMFFLANIDRDVISA